MIRQRRVQVNSEILTPAPTDHSPPEIWDRFQEHVAFRGDEFRYAIGPFEFKMSQLTFLELSLFNSDIEKGQLLPLLFGRSKPDNEYARLLAERISISDFLRAYVDVRALVGIQTEFVVYCKSVKKKALDMSRVAITQIEKNQQSTSSHIEDELKRLGLGGIGPAVFGIRSF